MALVVTNQAELSMLKTILNVQSSQDLVIRLYSNDHDPHVDDTLDKYQEVSGGDYKPKLMNPQYWKFTEGDPSEAEYKVVSWEFTGNVGPIYGYFVTGRDTGELLWAEKFTSGPFSIDRAGDQIRVVPKITLE